MKVLVVEDDDLVRMVAVEALTEQRFEVIEVATGEEALERCREGGADVLVTDICLPGTITGWDIAECCRSAKPGIAVVYASGFSHGSPRPVPGSVFFPKPYRLDQLLAAIRDFDRPS
jgi:CheY-like chemotaxis protein